MKFANRIKDIEVSGIRKMFELARKIENPIDFSLGQADFDMPAIVKLSAKHAIDKGENKYTPTEGNPELLIQLDNYLKTRFNLNTKNLAALIISGATGGLFLSLITLVE